MKNAKFVLMMIVILAGLLRLIALDKFPNGFTGDEAQQGYSAYSMFKTGKDEWGQTLPLNPRGFGDFKPPLYTYITVPSVANLGLNIFSTRLPAAVVGILSVIAVYFLALELVKDKKTALWSALFLAISPWSIQISRTAFEGGLGVLTFTLALIFFMRAQGSKIFINWLLSAVFFGLTLYTYHSWRVFTILFILGLVIIYRQKLQIKKIVAPLIILVIFVLPLLFSINTVLARSSDVGIFSNQQLSGYFSDKTGSELPVFVDKLLDNKIYYAANQFISNYLSYFSPNFLFTGGRSDGTYLNFPHFPLLYQIEILLWVIAVYLIVKGRIQNSKILVLWFLLAIIPASLAVGAMNANRAPTLLPLTAIISAIGANYLSGKLKWGNIMLGVVLSISLVMFGHFYFITLPQKPAENLRYGYQQVFESAINASKNYDKVIFSKAFTEPQIFVGFYGQIDPSRYQFASDDWLRYEKSDKLYVDQLESWNLENYYFQDIKWNERESKEPNALVVAKPGDFPEDVDYIQEIKDPKGAVLYKLVPTKQPAK